MQNYESQIQGLLSEIEQELNSVTHQLSLCPEGRIVRVINHDRPKIQHVIGKGPERHRTYITKDKSMQSLLARRYVLEEEEILLHTLYTKIEKCTEASKKIGTHDRQRILYDTFPWLDSAVVNMAIAYSNSKTEFEQGPFEQSTYRIEEKVKTTSWGLKVRSKSELLIAEALHKYNIPMRYEQVLNIGNNHVFVPDFTIQKSDGKIYYWEHAGLTNMKEYMDKHLHKMQLYASVGIVPWKNLIVTYDTEDGDIDLRIIEAEIKNKLL